MCSASGSDSVALVTGASRGLGLEFTRQLLSRPNQRCAAADSKRWSGDLLLVCTLARHFVVTVHVPHHLFIYNAHVAHSVVATCRSPESAANLQHLLKQHPDRLMLTAMDVVDELSIQVRLPSGVCKI